MYDVAVIGAGHAGCEAALAAARLGCRTLLVTTGLDTVAQMPCNPSVGGPAKGHLVREIDALGGEMGRNIDRTFIQIRQLNTGKGPAVQALRAQADKALYRQAMRESLLAQPGLALMEARVERLEVDATGAGPGSRGRVRGLILEDGRQVSARAVVLTTGTFLRGRLVTGDRVSPGGRAGEAPSLGLSACLSELGFPLRRLKTGTPPRIAAESIDYGLAQLQVGSATPLSFSLASRFGLLAPEDVRREPALPVYPNPVPTSWRPQLPCYLVHTNTRTHQLIRDNLDRSPLFSGLIEGVGPRYCPSIEDKVVRFAHKEAHQVFLEPEGWQTPEVYVQGMNTSLPEDVQWDMLRSIPALREVEIVRLGYAVEYDAVPTTEIAYDLQARRVAGLFLAGQINGTSGYEEAAAQGLVAGINAARSVRGLEAVRLRRDQAYIGVLIDDLITRDLCEPYRMMTARAEYRLLLRADNVEDRLADLGHNLGLLPAELHAAVVESRRRRGRALAALDRTWIHPGEASARALQSQASSPVGRRMSASELLRRPELGYQQVVEVVGAAGTAEAADAAALTLSAEAAWQVEVAIKYGGYVAKQEVEVRRLQRLEERRLPADLDYGAIVGLRTEAREQLQRFQPGTLGQASRIAGVNPADVAVLLVYLERWARRPMAG